MEDQLLVGLWMMAAMDAAEARSTGAETASSPRDQRDVVQLGVRIPVGEK